MELSKETQQRIWAITNVVTSQYETERKPVMDCMKEKH